jgi:drug/metabolite transporter (DMT)-like permease
MTLKYLLGVAIAISSGVFNNLGVLLQKKVVNVHASKEKGFMATLVKNWVWWLGMFLQVGVGMGTFVAAQALIGPALVPGLMASGLIVLALGSVKLMHEKLNLPEYSGILLMIVGITLLGLSELDIDIEVVRKALTSSDIVFRIGVFTVIMIVSCAVFHLVSLKSKQRKGIVMGFSNGFLFSLSNFWISPLTAIILIVLGGKGNSLQVVLFIAACVILVVSNLLAFTQIQVAFKFGQASNIIPVQQISVQITPILIYFFVFSLTPPKTISGVFIVAGALLIIASGFLLGRRQEEIENIK